MSGLIQDIHYALLFRLLLGLVALSASLVPTLRIARIDPAKTRRAD